MTTLSIATGVSANFHPAASRLALGTVQFGLPYGIANASGQVSLTEVEAILAEARIHGIDTLDTAIAYGDSEQRLGQLGVGGWRIISKLPPIPEGCPDVQGWTRQAVEGCLGRLKVNSLGVLLLHRPDQLSGTHGGELYAAMLQLRAEQLIGKLGISVYGPEELDELATRFAFDFVQAPFNAFDRRLVTSGWLARLKAAGTEVHARSIFLQGLLLMPPSARPARFRRWDALWAIWDRWISDSAVTPLQACLALGSATPAIDRIVVGVVSVAQLREIVEAAGRSIAPPPATLSIEDIDLINPSRWNAA